MDAGIAEATPKTEEPPKDEPKAEPKAEGDPAAKPVEPPKPEEDEAAKLGLKAKAAERFHELTAQVKDLAPLREALDKAGVKLEDLPKLAERAKVAEDLSAMVRETGATPEQYGSALDYLKMVNAAAKGDRQAAEAAYTVMEKELRVLAQLLGKEVPGVHDPLAQYQDLADAVTAGDMTRKYALEVAAARTQSSVVKHHQQSQTEQQTNAQAAQTAAAQLAALDAQWKQSDPHYAVRRPALSKMVEQIQATQPPTQWAKATQEAYAAIAAIPVAAPASAAPAKPPVGPVPLRPTGARPTLVPQTDDPYEAMNLGIASVRG